LGGLPAPRILGLAAAFAAACAFSGLLLGARGEPQRSTAPAEPGNPLKFLIQGEEFQSPAIRAQQADDFDNPAFPTVEAGETAWSSADDGKSCQECHGAGKNNALKRVAAGYPKYVAAAQGVITLQTRINLCRKNQLGLSPLAENDPRMIGLTVYLRWLARGTPSAVDIQGPNAEVFERGGKLYRTKLGLYQISCAQCHNEKFGQKFGAETLSQGHPLAYPAYKASEGRVISLHERFRMCNKLARAEGQPDNAPDYVALELYLDWRSKSLPITAPGVRP
jgi:L-cysteine S-thiosulfotransferase